MAKIFKWLFVLLVICIAVVWKILQPAPIHANRQANIIRPTAKVRVIPVAYQTMPSYNEFAGSVQSLTTVQITARIVAHIQKMPANTGTIVKKGDLLVQLNDGDIRAKIQQAQANLAAAETTKATAERDVVRYQELVRRQIESKQKLDQVETLAKNASLAVEAARQQIAELSENLSYTEIKAPFDGMVVEKLAETGDLASPSRVLLTFQDYMQLRLEAPVSEQCASRIRLNDKILINIDTTSAEFSAKVSEIVPAIDVKSRSFLVRANLPPSQTNLKPGMFGRMKFPCSPRQILAIPNSAFRSAGQLDLVFIADEGQAKLRIIRTGEKFENYTEILSGLKAGDSIISHIQIGDSILAVSSVEQEHLQDGDQIIILEK